MEAHEISKFCMIWVTLLKFLMVLHFINSFLCMQLFSDWLWWLLRHIFTRIWKHLSPEFLWLIKKSWLLFLYFLINVLNCRYFCPIYFKWAYLLLRNFLGRYICITCFIGLALKSYKILSSFIKTDEFTAFEVHPVKSNWNTLLYIKVLHPKYFKIKHT